MAEDPPLTVTNTTPIISLAGLDHLWILEHVVERLVVPLEVWIELAADPTMPEPALLARLPNVEYRPLPLLRLPETEGLDDGERAAITLAKSLNAAAVLVDETAGRKVAKQLGLNVRGTLGLLLEAKRMGLVPRIGPLIERMVMNGDWLSPRLIEQVLEHAGER